MKLVIKNTKGVYRVMDIDVRFRKDVQRIVVATSQALPKGEEVVEVHLNTKGKWTQAHRKVGNVIKKWGGRTKKKIIPY